MSSVSLNLNTLAQSGVALVLGLAIRKLWKKIDSIEPLAAQVQALTKALENAEGTVKGAFKTIEVVKKEHHKLSNRVTAVEKDCEWLKEKR